jgi:hypothetical protein
MTDKAQQKRTLTAQAHNQIERLRPRLLDLTRRNPLISTPLRGRSLAYLRVVDELPEQLAGQLADGMCFTSLPRLADFVPDEKTDSFKNAFAAARLTDENYLNDLKELDTRDISPSELEAVERALRDRVRKEFGMPQRNADSGPSIEAHARAQGIAPSYDLPEAPARSGTRRHRDKQIQTLLLPDQLERRGNALINKARTWQQEAGLNVLHVAFGLVEWSAPNERNSCFAPLLLAPVEMRKDATGEGPIFSVSQTEEDLEVNAAFAQMLKQDFDLVLPPYDKEQGIEVYLATVAALAPQNLGWRVRRQVVFGVFPSARLAMFHDLDPERHAAHPVICELLTGSERVVASPFADDYETDDLDAVGAAPPIVLNADASQLSTVVDALSGRNLAIEGPPGTGKSQTIVNIIAAAIAQGKKVLFVAEKLAALEVVQARLRAVGLDPFVMSLQASRSGREQVIASLRERLLMPRPRASGEWTKTIANFRAARDELGTYLTLIGSQYRETGWTIHEVLGKGMMAHERLEDAPQSLVACKLPNPDVWTPQQVEIARQKASELAAVAPIVSASRTTWQGIGYVSVDRITLQEIVGGARLAVARAQSLAAILDKVPALNEPLDALATWLERARAFLKDVEMQLWTLDHVAFSRLLLLDDPSALTYLVEQCKRVQQGVADLGVTLANPLEPGWTQKLEALAAICRSRQIEAPSPALLKARVDSLDDYLSKLHALDVAIKPILGAEPSFASRSIKDLDVVVQLVKGMSNAVLVSRGPSLLNHRDRMLAAQALTEASQVRRTMDDLKARLVAIPDEDAQVLATAGKTLRDTGIFGRLGSSYRQAKRLYRAYAPEKRFRRGEAAAALIDASRLKQGLTSLDPHGAAKAVFGPLWREVDSDFDGCHCLIAFVEALDVAFPQLADRDFKERLVLSSPDVLRGLPAVDPQLNQSARLAELASLHDEATGSRAADAAALERLEALVTGLPDPGSLEPERLDELARTISEIQCIIHELDQAELPGIFFGVSWQGSQSDAERLSSILAAAAVARDAGIAPILAQSLAILDITQLAQTLDQAAEAYKTMVAALAPLPPESEAWWRRLMEKTPREASAHLTEAADDQDGLQAHAAFALHRRDLEQLGLDQVVESAVTNPSLLAKLPELVEAVVFRSLALGVHDDHKAILGKFIGTRIEQFRKDIAHYDRRIIELTAKKVRAEAFNAADPPSGISQGRVGDLTEVSLIRHEADKQKRFIPVRNLVERAANALQQLKPCWMMSPLAVAQYLPHDLTFDLCVIDEASQMPPEDALGAIARAKQVMVVGDTNQLPPTNFFRKIFDDSDDEELNKTSDAVVDESILELANKVFRPARRLRWHYRSRHESLIAFSNRHIYDGDLIVFPSPDERGRTSGVELEKVEGCYQSGINAIEAKTIVERALQFMRDTPDRSLGLVTMNLNQRELIWEELNHALQSDPVAAAYIADWEQRNQGLEAFFVKNLENVQGDERDAIFISTVYGPAETGGPVMQRFGPINGIAGRRRLNVLFSRAKQRILTVTSLTPADILAEESGNQGAFLLKSWLAYAKTGQLEQGHLKARAPDSPFEEFVARQITAMGLTAVHQVGVSGYFVDIGIKHPAWPHGYVIGVECDGASYHSSRSARDRDRLRQEVMEGLGWRLHRIWSTDWFLNPRLEIQRLDHAINARLREGIST